MKNGRYERGDPHPDVPGKVFWAYECKARGRKPIWHTKERHDKIKAGLRSTGSPSKEEAAAMREERDSVITDKNAWYLGRPHPTMDLVFKGYSSKSGKPVWLQSEVYRKLLDGRVPASERRRLWEERDSVTLEGNWGYGDKHPTMDLVFSGWRNGVPTWRSTENHANILKRRRVKDGLTREERAANAKIKSDVVKLRKQTNPWTCGDKHPETGLFFLVYMAGKDGLLYERWGSAEELKQLRARSKEYSRTDKGQATRCAYYRNKRVTKMTKALLGLGDKLNKLK